jgi:metal-responsive CopG/Arc/MetJ family transcriptional regulator
MRLYKRTYSIEENILKAFENAVQSGNRSVVVTDLLRDYLAEKEREEIRQALITGLPEMSDLYLEESKAWYPLEEEVYEKANRVPQSRRHHTSRPRSRARA